MRNFDISQGIPRGLAGPLAGRGVSQLSSPTPPPEAAQEQEELNSHHNFDISQEYRL
jgi:hypothetical protein